MSVFFLNWSWIGLGLALAWLAVLFGTDLMRTDLSRNRWFDRYWLGGLGGVLYLLHNFEEYGVNLLGKTYAFPSEMMAIIHTNVNDWLFVSVNLPLFWVVAPMLGYVAWKKRLEIAPACMAGIMLVNSVMHSVSGLANGYNSGLLTTWLVFVPYSLWAFYICFGNSAQKGKKIALVIGLGLAYHILMIAIFMLNIHQIIPTLLANALLVALAWVYFVTCVKADNLFKAEHLH